MHPPTPNPTETSLGMFNEREDLLEQVARKSRVARWGRAIARVAFILLVVGILAVITVGPGRAIDWVGSYLIPVAVITGVVIASLALLVWVVKRLPESPFRDRLQ